MSESERIKISLERYKRPGNSISDALYEASYSLLLKDNYEAIDYACFLADCLEIYNTGRRLISNEDTEIIIEVIKSIRDFDYDDESLACLFQKTDINIESIYLMKFLYFKYNSDYKQYNRSYYDKYCLKNIEEQQNAEEDNMPCLPDFSE